MARAETTSSPETFPNLLGAKFLEDEKVKKDDVLFPQVEADVKQIFHFLKSRSSSISEVKEYSREPPRRFCFRHISQRLGRGSPK
jgi:hypothetical protein